MFRFRSGRYFWVSSFSGYAASLVVMLIFFPLMHRLLGTLRMLLLLPLTCFFIITMTLFFPVPFLWVLLKLIDKALGFSIYRVEKELLYMQTSRAIKYKAKAVIDMFGLRLGEVLSALMVMPMLVYISWLQLSILSLAVLSVVIALIVGAVRQANLLGRRSVGSQVS